MLLNKRAGTTGSAERPVCRDPQRLLSAATKREIRQRLRDLFEYARLRTPPLVPAGFRNPMSQSLIGGKPRAGNAVSDPPVSDGELAAIVGELDAYALGLLAPLLLYGPRPSELGRILRADYDESTDFLRVLSRPESGYRTKGRCDKAWPVTDTLAACLGPFLGRSSGPLLVKRKIFEGKAAPTLRAATEAELASAFQADVAETERRLGRALSKIETDAVSKRVWAGAGAVDARCVLRELQRGAARTGLSRMPTPKDLRHAMESHCEAARLSPGVIRFLLGHAPTRGDALPSYNHTGREMLREQVAILEERRRVLVEALLTRTRDLCSRGGSAT